MLEADEVRRILRETPRRLATLTAGIDPDRLHAPPDFGGWSLNDVLAHLRSCSDVWGSCIRTILAEDAPALEAVNPRRWIRSTDYPEQPFRRSLRAFTMQRDELLAVLDPLPAEQWTRTANVKVWGRIFQRTVHFYAHWLAGHERSHWRQMERIADAVRA